MWSVSNVGSFSLSGHRPEEIELEEANFYKNIGHEISNLRAGFGSRAAVQRLVSQPQFIVCPLLVRGLDIDGHTSPRRSMPMLTFELRHKVSPASDCKATSTGRRLLILRSLCENLRKFQKASALGRQLSTLASVARRPSGGSRCLEEGALQSS